MSIHSFLPDTGDDGHEARLDAELAETEALFGAELKALLDPDAGLSARTRLEVNDALLARSALSLTVDLLSVGWQTVRVMFGPTDPFDRSDRSERSERSERSDLSDLSNASNASNEPAASNEPNEEVPS